jgi:hypothetical protein
MIDIFQGTGAPLTPTGFDSANKVIDPANNAPDQASKLAALWCILAVETRGFGYQSDKRLKVLFERHIFHQCTGGRFDAIAPDLSNPVPGGYSGGAAEYDRIKRAVALDRKAALESASWGLGQVMGFNATSIAYQSTDSMIADFNTGEDAQLLGCARFITATSALQKAFISRNWARVAFFYNGKNYAKNHYDTNLAANYAKFQQKAPDIDIRAAQARLTYLGFNPGGIDGIAGALSVAALKAFQQSKSQDKVKPLQVNGNFDDKATLAALQTVAGI